MRAQQKVLAGGSRELPKEPLHMASQKTAEVGWESKGEIKSSKEGQQETLRSEHPRVHIRNTHLGL